MAISVFNLFSIGIGPSSSHTVGPMRAAKKFLETLAQSVDHVKQVSITVYGSLAFTGKGHGTDKALIMGLCGESPESIDPNHIPAQLQKIKETHQINLLKTHTIPFNYDTDLIYNYTEQLPPYSNAMRFKASLDDGSVIEDVYFSIGGGFIVQESEIEQSSNSETPLPFPFSSGSELLSICEREKITIADLMLANEASWRSVEEIHQKLLHIASVMETCIDAGCKATGHLEGRLHVRRRANALYNHLLEQGLPNPSHPQAMSWLNVFAMAVNEENAAGGRVVTAPTNGAAGIIPAVLHYYRLFFKGNDNGIINYLLTAGAIGILYKKNASISGAEVGCQGEVGVACSMAAAGLVAALGGSIYQVENAAEIGMEHNLGLTCDPVDGLVQIPCIERNAMGAVKAVNAALLALAGDGQHTVSLDAVIKTMSEIGKNMNSIYKETSLGGLAVNVPEC